MVAEVRRAIEDTNADQEVALADAVLRVEKVAAAIIAAGARLRAIPSVRAPVAEVRRAWAKRLMGPWVPWVHGSSGLPPWVHGWGSPWEPTPIVRASWWAISAHVIHHELRCRALRLDGAVARVA